MCCNTNKNNKNPILCKFGYVDYIILASTISIALAEEFDTTDLGILATFFAVLADELALIGSIQNCPSDNNGTNNDMFVPPVPDVALTTSNDFTNIYKSKKRTVIKKIKRKKL